MKQLKQQWEDRLSEFGLSTQQIENQETLTLPTPTRACFGIQDFQFDKQLDYRNWRDNLERCPIGREQLSRFHEMPTESYARTIPAWTLSDFSVRVFLLASFPKLHVDEGHTRRAATASAIIYRYFRLFEPASAIAADLNMKVENVELRIARIKLAAAYLGL